MAFFTLWTLPEIQGGCIPIEWTLTGRGSLEVFPYPTNQYAQYPCPDPNPYLVVDCNDIVITAKDRCGTEKTITATCCDYDGPGKSPVSISYTSLSMVLETEQSVTALGGCPPYSWSVSGPGTITVDQSRPQRDLATYKAPPTNFNCQNNDSITVTDCCGVSSTITLHTSNSSPSSALRICDVMVCAHDCQNVGGLCHFHGTFGMWMYSCGGLLNASGFWDGNNRTEWACYDGPQISCAYPSYPPPCHPVIKSEFNPCTAGLCSFPSQPCGTVLDIRTELQKEQGCCPINPWTGLPL
jgi:hypothetical protein